MKKTTLCLLIVSLINAKKFDEAKFKKMTNDMKFEYCNLRFTRGLKKFKTLENLKKSPSFLEEQPICCQNIKFDSLSDKNKKQFSTWGCKI